MDRDRTVTGEAEDPTGGRADPRCPSCGEAVGARAQYCIHCWTDLPDDTQYDDVTGGTHEVSYERDQVTAGTPTVGDSGGVLETLRSVTDGTDARDSRDVDQPPVPSGLGTDGPTFLPDLLDDGGRALQFLGALGLVGAVAVFWAGLGLVFAGVLVAGVAWAGSVVSLARERSGFDAMQYGSYSMMLTLICCSFALAFGAGESAPVPVALTLVPVAVSTLLVGGLGSSVADYRPE